VVAILKPISHYAFAVNEENLEHHARRRPPASTKCGVSRYEVWRLPPAGEGATGFVGIAIVADLTGHRDIFGQIAKEIDYWRESIRYSSLIFSLARCSGLSETAARTSARGDRAPYRGLDRDGAPPRCQEYLVAATQFLGLRLSPREGAWRRQ
jgi:hypothetical protein